MFSLPWDFSNSNCTGPRSTRAAELSLCSHTCSGALYPARSFLLCFKNEGGLMKSQLHQAFTHLMFCWEIFIP